MRRHSGDQTDQGKVLDDCFYVTFTLGLLLQESRYYKLYHILYYNSHDVLALCNKAVLKKFCRVY